MRTILIADDSACFRESLALLLQQQGYAVLSANDGGEALELLDAQKVDLLVTDLVMPGVDGLTLLSRLAGLPAARGVPVIVCTASTDREDVIRVARLGVRDYIVKTPEALGQVLDRIAKRLRGEGGRASTTAPPATVAGATTAARAKAPAAAPATPPASRPPASGPAQPAPASTPEPLPPAEALKSLKPIVTCSQMEETIARCGEIKALSPAVAQLMKLCNSPACSIEQVVRVVRQDQAIALKILKLANSVVYTRGEPVDSVHKAVTRIGLAQIRQAVMNISVIEQFSLNNLGDRLSSAPFWEHSIAVGLIAAELVHARGGSVEEADHAFTAGLLHDVGRMVYAQEIPDLYRQVLDAADRLQLPLEQVESRMLLINHADMMEKLLTSWRLPRPLIAPIGMHHLSMGNVRQLAPNSVTEIGTLVLANALAHALLLGSSGNEALYATQDLVAGLGLAPRVIADIVAKIPDQTQDIKLTMLSHAPSPSWKGFAQQVHDRIGAPLRPLTLGAETAADAVAIFAQRLASPEASGPPNLIIAHLRHPRERATLSEALRRAEAESHAAGLPLVVFSATGTLSLEDRLCEGRAVVKLPMPCALSRFTEAVAPLLARSESPAVPAAA